MQKDINGSLGDKAYRIIKEKIVNGEFKQGGILSISAMSKDLNISRTPITNACQKLEKERFLTIIPKHGVIINTVSLTNAREIYELRAALETYFAEKIFFHIDDEDIKALEKSYENQIISIKKNDIEGFIKEDMNFHKYILDKTKNQEVMNVIDNVLDRAYLLGIESCKSDGRLEQNIVEHGNIIKSLKEKDKDNFVKGIETNILNGLSNLLGNII